MRMTRAFGAALLIATLGPSVAAAQQGRQFQDAWFWGLKVGGMGYGRPSLDPAQASPGYSQAIAVGAEWLLTRTHGGLYVSYSHALLNSQTIIPSSASSTDTTFRIVDIDNVRRFDMALMGFPGTHLKVHPYVGAGFSLNSIANATPQGTYNSNAELQFTNSLVQELKSVFQPVFIGGVQYRLAKASAFAQLSVSPTNSNYLLYSGRSINYSYEIGLRYNIGTSIER